MDTVRSEMEGSTIARPAALSGAAEVFAVFRTSGLEPLRGRRGWVLFLLAFLPIFFMILGRIFGMSRGGGSLFFLYVLVPIYQYINMIVFIFLGCATLGEGIDDRTIAYDLICPVHRTAIYAGKYLAYMVSAMLILLPVTAAAYMLCMSLHDWDMMFRNLSYLLAVSISLVVAALVYGSFLILLSLLIKRAVLVSIILAVGIEGFIAHLPLTFSKLSIYVHLRSLMSLISGDSRFREMIKDVYTTDLEPVESIIVLCLGWVIFTMAGVAVFKRKQFP